VILEPRLLGRAMIRADDEAVNVGLACGSQRPSIERHLQFYICDFLGVETARF
jgi:hypothetical protein